MAKQTQDKAQPTISLCMMVKDEEGRLPTALDSAKPWVDEIVVVDTGSSDRTVEIAKSYGAKVYHHPWENSFSKHRNQSISYATGDWLLILDADEELDQKTAPLMRRLIRNPDVNCFLFEMYNDLVGGSSAFVLHPRLFRNHVGFRYQGQVHNEPVVPGRIARSPVRLIHHGYALDTATMEKKHQRRVGMIRKWIESEPDSSSAHAYLAQALSTRPQDAPEAVETALCALRLAREQGAQARDLPRIYYPLLLSLAQLGRDQEVLEYAEQCLNAVPIYPDPLYFSQWAHYRRKEWEQACSHSERFMKAQEDARRNPDAFLFFENLTYSQIPVVLHRWVMAEMHRGQPERALEVYDRLLGEEDAEIEEMARQGALGCIHAAEPGLALKMCRRAAESHPDWTWPARVEPLARSQAGESENRENKRRGLEAIKAGDHAGALQHLDRALEGLPLDPELHVARAHALIGLGREQEAEEGLCRGLSLNPGQPWAWQWLAQRALDQGRPRAAEHYLRRGLEIDPGSAEARTRLEGLRARLADGEPEATLRREPPRMVIFLVPGLSPATVAQAPPSLLMGRAWGEALLDEVGGASNGARWMSLYTGRPLAEHRVGAQADRGQPAGLADSAVSTMWEVLAKNLTLGLMAIPLGHPAPELPGWAVSGFPAGPLEPGLVHPPEALAPLLAGGYRPDFNLSDLEDQVYCMMLDKNISHLGRLAQVERTKISCAYRLPPAQVLALGFTNVERLQACYPPQHPHVISAYWQLYGWIEGLLAGLGWPDFAILSQQGRRAEEGKPPDSGFYCLSWLRGERGKAPLTGIAPEILKRLGADPADLGRPRG